MKSSASVWPILQIWYTNEKDELWIHHKKNPSHFSTWYNPSLHLMAAISTVYERKCQTWEKQMPPANSSLSDSVPISCSTRVRTRSGNFVRPRMCSNSWRTISELVLLALQVSNYQIWRQFLIECMIRQLHLQMLY